MCFDTIANRQVAIAKVIGIGILKAKLKAKPSSQTKTARTQNLTCFFRYTCSAAEQGGGVANDRGRPKKRVRPPVGR